MDNSFSLTESVDLFGQINSADLILNDIWIEPENPRSGEVVTIHGSVYNAGIIPIEEVSDAVTVAYIVNGEIVEINLLENILPGLENGRVISSGAVFNAVPGTYIITGIVNYHDTLSHLRDNPGNNIVQKVFHIGVKSPLIANFETYQYYNDETKKQQITIEGETTNILLEKSESKEIIIDIEGVSQEKIISDIDGQFLFNTNIPFKDKPIKISIYSNEDSFLTSSTQKIFPIKMDKSQSALALEINPYSSENNLKYSALTVVLFQDSYDHMFEKISTDIHNNQNSMTNNLFLTSLPADHKYIAEVYLEGRLLDAFENYFPSNAVIEKKISISESAQIQFRTINELGEPQDNVNVDNWIYSGKSNENGVTDWIKILPTFTTNEPYVAKATFPDGEIVWSEPFLIEPKEKKVITIVKGNSNP
jgi:hypothetical protein